MADRIIDPDELRAEMARTRTRQADLAARVGVSRSTIALVCKGFEPSAATARRILAALGPEGARRVAIQPNSPKAAANG